MDFVDRILTCTDCGGEFIFTAGEQLFFLDKQFKNDPKRCKPCKSRRGAQSAGAANSGGLAAAGISRTETRTVCSECGIETTVPFKPTQGRPVLCRQCYKNKPAPSAHPAQTASASAAQTASDSEPASSQLTPSATGASQQERRQPQPEFSAEDVSLAI
ncbi:MAG TPA: zinc-ribbon domain containing protein [Acidobacteriaceae bacterium]|jgi:CxxC-x17-CxxC domain-containing protein|nr:zinc-ribbon domain containing protein [Acidobacteriaceae bacterium]